MIPIYNIKHSYTWYRKEALKIRFNEILRIFKGSTQAPIVDIGGHKEQLLREADPEKYERLPIKLIERYEKHYGITPKQKPITYTTYKNIVQGYFKFLVKKLFEGHEVKLGAKLGIICIRGKKVKPTIDWKGDVKGIAPSWSKTKVSWNEKAEKLGLSLSEYIEQVPKSERKLVFCFNEHSDYIKYRIVWFKRNVIVKNKIYYGLTFNRVNRRQLWKLINEGKEYLVSERI